MRCVICDKEIEKSASDKAIVCEECNSEIEQRLNQKEKVKNVLVENFVNEKKKIIFKKWWFWLIIIFIVGTIISESSSTSPTNSTSQTTEKYQKNSNIEVTVIDFSTMSREDILTWMETNKINGTITDEYSDTIEKGKFVEQSVSANTTIHEGDSLKVVYSLGKEPTTEQKMP